MAAKKKAAEVDQEEVSDVNDDDILDVVELEENLEDAEAPELLPPGNYNGEIVMVDRRTSQRTGRDYWAFEIHIPTDEFPSGFDHENYPEGARVYWQPLMVPVRGDRRAMYNAKVFLEKLGLSSKTTRLDPNEWMGASVKAKIQHTLNPNTGEKRLECKGIEAAD